VNVLIRENLSEIRLFDVSFYHSVKLPVGTTGTQRFCRLLEGLLPEDGIRSQEKRTWKRYPAVVALQATAGQGSQQPVRA